MAWETVYDFAQSWTGQDWSSPAARTRRIDPYHVWAEATDYRDLGGRPDAWVPVIIELAPVTVGGKKKISTAEFAAALDRRADNQGTGAWIQLRDWYRNPQAFLVDASFCTALVNKTFFEKLLSDAALQDLIARVELALPIVHAEEIDESRSIPAVTALAHRSNGAPQCIVGVIDDGIAFAHERFRGHDGTRVEFFWDQGPYRRGATVEYGRELTNAVIDDLVARHTHAGVVDEESLYRAVGYLECRRRAAHGTFMLDAAAGDASNETHAGSPQIIAVQLQTPSRKTRDRAAGWLAARVLDGVRYILDRADKAAPAGAPLVVNLSFGNIAGPHDGTSTLESALSELIDLRQRLTTPFEVVIAVGNSNQVRCRAQLDIAGRETKTLRWCIAPDDATPSFVEIWVDPAGPGNEGCEVVITTPTGDACMALTEGAVRVWRPQTDVLCTAVYAGKVATGDRALVLVAVAPTVSKGRRRETAPAGEWKIAVTNRNMGKHVSADAWIQRDDTPWDFPRHGRQSHFADVHYDRFEHARGPAAGRAAHGREKDDDTGSTSPVKHAGTINSIATGNGTIPVGAFHASHGRPAPYSSSGPALGPQGAAKIGPDAAAVSDLSSARWGVIGAGSRSGSAVRMNGTSVAAAAITRLVAYEMQKFGWNGRQTLAQIAQDQEIVHRDEYKNYPRVPERVGAGRIMTPAIYNGRPGITMPVINNGRQGKVKR